MFFFALTEMRVFLLLLLLQTISGDDDDGCEINACEALKLMKNEVETDNVKNEYMQNLERRLRSLEQPGEYSFQLFQTIKFFFGLVWLISDEDDRWLRCTKGPCKCRPETKSLSCWHSQMPSLPAEQVIPFDIRNM